MLRIASLAILVLGSGCYSHARGHARCATPLAVDLLYAVGSAADIVITAVRADRAAYAVEDQPSDDEADEITAAIAALAAAPVALDREMVATTLAETKPRLSRCARATAQPIKISVAVLPAGTVAGVILRDHVDPATSDCVIDTLQTALFPMTKRGGEFTYPFML